MDLELHDRSQAFKNQFNQNPFHEVITVQALSFLKPEVRNLLAVKNASFDALNLTFAPAHFDNCTFRETSLAIRGYQEEAVAHALEFPPPFSCPTYAVAQCDVLSVGDAALSNFARSLHPVQDFYAHSNWVEIFADSRLVSDTLEPYPFLFGGRELPGVVVVDDSLGGGPNSSWRVQPASGNVYPEKVLPKACPLGAPPSACLPALVTGRTDEPTGPFSTSPVATFPNRCPPNIRIYHDADLAKDLPDGVRMFSRAMLLAKQQTTHEWCRFQNLVYEKHGAGGVKFLCENWVNDRAQANEACPTLRDEARCKPPAVSIVAGEGHTCASGRSEGVLCWGAGSNGQLGNGQLAAVSTPVAVTGITGAIRSLAAGSHHNCAALDNGEVRCWGLGSSGQLGNGSFYRLPPYGERTPVAVTHLAGPVKAVTAGWRHSCAVLEDGRVQCWGSGASGELGDGSYYGGTARPVFVVGLAGPVRSLAAAFGVSCALLENGTVQCWGSGEDGELGNGSYDSSAFPSTVVGLAGRVRAIAARAGHVCALLESGGIQCWGIGSNGELGDGTFRSGSSYAASLPVSVVGLGGPARAIAVGYGHSCAALERGGIECWGLGRYGALGNGLLYSAAPFGVAYPVPVVGITDTAETLAAFRHTCARMTNDEVYCWGTVPSLVQLP